MLDRTSARQPVTQHQWPSGYRVEYTGRYADTNIPQRLTLQRGRTFPRDSKNRPTSWSLIPPNRNDFSYELRSCIAPVLITLFCIALLAASIYYATVLNPQRKPRIHVESNIQSPLPALTGRS